MRKYENELNKMFTEKVVEYLGKGYLFLNEDSSMGYFQRIELYKDDKKIRLTMKENTWFEIEGKQYYNIDNFEFEAYEMSVNDSFINDDSKLIEKENFYIYRKQIISKDVNELIKFSEISDERIENRIFNQNHEFYPNSRIKNIKGFKCFKKGEVKIVRVNKNTRWSKVNEYILENPKTGNKKIIEF